MEVMSPSPITESEVEQVALACLANIGWQVVHGPDIAPDTPGAERTDYGHVVLVRMFRPVVQEEFGYE